MKTLNRHNLALAKLAPSGASASRYISAIHVTPDETQVTNGHAALAITTAENGDKDKPAEFKPFLLPRSLALQMAHDLPALGI